MPQEFLLKLFAKIKFSQKFPDLQYLKTSFVFKDRIYSKINFVVKFKDKFHVSKRLT